MAETVADAANVAAGALFFGQFLGDQPLSLAAMAGGLAAWIMLAGFAVLLAGKDN